MDRTELLKLWNDMAREGNWVPSWTDSLSGISAEEAAWTPGAGCHSIWQEVVHVTFWRRATLRMMSGGSGPAREEVDRDEFRLPPVVDGDAWADALQELERSHVEIAAAIQDPGIDVGRVPYHLIHDAYHLGRITQLRGMRGTPPVF